jgi:serine/threonine protein kinase
MASHMVDWLLDPLPPGTEVGPWRLVRHRGGGSYGTVYLAERVGSGQQGPFALKLATTSMDMRFEREAALLCRIRHLNVPVLRDWGMWTHPSSVPLPYLVMDWVEGVSLYDWAAQQPRTSRQMLRVLGQLARALEATHRARCLHRDVKGDNVLVSAEGRAFLMDFGAGKFQGARQLTYALLPPGTPQYRSPQALRFQWAYRNQRAAQYEHTQADDVYALGVAAYRAVTGLYPPPGFDLARAVEPARPAEPPLQPPKKLVTVCRELDGLVLRMLSDAPEARGSAGEVAQALEQAAERASSKADAPITPRPQRGAAQGKSPLIPKVAALGLAAAVGGAALAISSAWRVHPREDPPREAQQAREEGRGTVALGDSAPAVPEAPSSQPTSSKGLGLDMPKRPLPGQVLPPCRGVDVEIELTPGRKDTRSCWIEVKATAEKCKENGYEHRGGCYVPRYLPPRLPQSIER